MDYNYLETYMSMDGRFTQRTLFESLRIKLFAGFKFMFDRVFALLGIIITLPLMFIIALAIKLDSKGPVLFKQTRTGKHGELFTMYKFRTMVDGNDVHDFKRSDEHTKIGKFLRKTSLDELPQLFSIAIGKMSFIGPRPWIHDYYEKMNEAQRRRYAVRPGLTGLAQAMGRNNITIFEKIEYDLIYINNYSLYQDIKVIFLTIKAVFSGSGADAGKENIQKELDALSKQNNKNIMSK